MKWIEIGFGLVLVLVAHIGALFFGWNFKLYFALLIVALFIASHLLVQWLRARLARQLVDCSPEEIDAILADLDEEDRRKTMARIEKEKARISGFSVRPARSGPRATEP